jgi:regulatory protein
MEAIQYQKALSKAMELCSRSEKCISEIGEKLKAWGVDTSDSDKIIHELVKQKFIDEERYARAFVRDKYRFNQWGRIKIQFMLKGKQIPANVIENAFCEIDEEAYLQVLVGLLRQKQRSIKAATEHERNAKLIRFAQSRGFEYESITHALKKIKAD